MHPDAATHFNNQAESLLSELAGPPESKDNTDEFKPDFFISETYTDKDIVGDIDLIWIDHLGVETARFFQQGSGLLGLQGDSYRTLVGIAERIQKTRTFDNAVSLHFLKDALFEWLKERHKNITDVSMTDYVIQKCIKEIRELEVWLPIAMTCTEAEFIIGKVSFKTLSKRMFDEWQESIEAPKGMDAEKEQLRQFLLKQRRELQGLAAAVVKIVAEPRRAREIAVEQSEKALAILRFFSLANLLPQKNSYCTLFGKENVQRMRSILVQENRAPIFSGGSLGLASSFWILDNKVMAMSRNGGLDILGNMLADEKRTKFQNSILEAIYIYSKSALAKELTDKLVYICVALESFLLKNNSEPVQQNLGERMAMITFQASDRRKSLIKNVRDVYMVRSAFIHHGQSVSSHKIEIMKEFMLNAWTFLCRVILNSHRFLTKEELIDAVDRAKLCGGDPFSREERSLKRSALFPRCRSGDLIALC